ncbi:MAG: 30S ribosomal protein S27ae [Nanoarchaeota archaeon]
MAGKKKPKNKAPSRRYKKYQIVGDMVTRQKTCPKCGPAMFLATHKDRYTCGFCGYCEFNKK